MDTMSTKIKKNLHNDVLMNMINSTEIVDKEYLIKWKKYNEKIILIKLFYICY